MVNIKSHILFPTPVFESKLNDFANINSELEKYIYGLREKNFSKKIAKHLKSIKKIF